MTGRATMMPTEAVLADFVQHSQRIEGEPANLDHPRAAEHFEAARTVVDGASLGMLLKPRTIHALIMRGFPRTMPGQYRRAHVAVGGYLKVPPEFVPRRMEALLRKARDASRPGAASEGVLWNLHHEFEAIHPFLDGNGRTGRLWWNALRLRAGFDWRVVRFEERGAYYQAIRDWEVAEHARQMANGQRGTPWEWGRVGGLGRAGD